MAEPIPFIQARNCGPDRAGLPIALVVIHTMESAEKPTTARAVAQWFAGPQAPQASAHFCVDSSETIQCVREDVVAWAAPGANKTGIHIEHAGYAAQTAPQWDDDFSRAMLGRSAALAADICLRHSIPVQRLTVAALRAGGARGLCGHVDITHAFNGGKGHTDPGAAFPWDRYLALIRAALQSAAEQLSEDDKARAMALVAQTSDQIVADEFSHRLDGSSETPNA